MARLRYMVFGCALFVAACGAGNRGAVTMDGAATTEATTTTAATVTTAASVTPSMPPGAKRITFTTSDGLMLEGTVFGTGNDAVVLGAMGGSDMETWFPFAEVLADEGYTALAYNMRGHGGSEGPQLLYQVGVDAQAAVDFIRQSGARRVFYFGASVNGVAAMAVGAENDLAGVVDLSGPLGVSMALDAVELAPRVEEPKLFIVAEGDGPIPGMLQAVFDAAPEPKDMVVYTGDAHGTDLFGTHGDELTELLLDFVVSN